MCTDVGSGNGRNPLSSEERETFISYSMRYHPDAGWSEADLLPQSVTDFQLEGIHTQEVFQNVHAYRSSSGKIQLFGCREAARKINALCNLLGLPTMEEELYVDCLKKAVKANSQNFPMGGHVYLDAYTSMTEYARPYIPFEKTGSFFKIQMSLARVQRTPCRLYAENTSARNLAGGGHMMNTGNCRTSILPALRKAWSMGYDDILWLTENVYLLEQTCQANLFLVTNGKVITPPAPLGGSVRSDLMRDCVIDLLRSWHIDVKETILTYPGFETLLQEGHLEELFIAGTESGIRPVEQVYYKGKTSSITCTTKSLANRLQDTIWGIQTDSLADPFRWLTYVDKH